MKIYLNELSDLDTDLDFTEKNDWVVAAVHRLDETGETAAERSSISLKPLSVAPQLAPAQAHFNIRMVDEVVVVNGDATAEVSLVCSRCAVPFRLKLAPTFSSLFCKDPVMAGVGYLESKGKPGGQNKGFARHAAAMTDPSQDLDITYLSEDAIDLGEILTEQLQLRIPFQPLCQEECKGLCPTCGSDWNTGRCACAKIHKESAFSVLKNLSLKG